MKTAFSLVFGAFVAMGSLWAQTPSLTPSDSTLKIEGTKGLKFSGVCVSTSDPQVKRSFEGAVPMTVSFNAKIERCSVEKSADHKGEVILEFFHKEKMLVSQKFGGPTIGIQFVIPW